MSQDRVTETVWPWRRPAPAVATLTPAERRRRALLEVGIMLAVAGLLRVGFDKVWVPRLIAALAAFVAIGGLFVPPLYEGFKRAMLAFGHAVGVAFAWLLLVPFFYICFPFGRLCFRLRGSDPLQRRFDGRRGTYWIARHRASDAERYSRQF